ncbi:MULTISPECIES: hypothetical protein [unclassified Pseudomonas]|uniref:hypothetical protein n=1 Tax=unclassified Pseudomonas TaxID=196821 RepID=UPI0030D9BB41
MGNPSDGSSDALMSGASLQGRHKKIPAHHGRRGLLKRCRLAGLPLRKPNGKNIPKKKYLE